MYIIATESEEDRLNCLEEQKKSFCESRRRGSDSEEDGEFLDMSK